MGKVKYKSIKWEEIGPRKRAEFKMLFYSSLRHR